MRMNGGTCFMHRSVGAVLLATLVMGCSVLNRRPQTPGERASGFGYVPLDGLAVDNFPDKSCLNDDGHVVGTPRPLLDLLPDLTVRFAVASFSGDGALTFGPAKVTTAGGAYRAVLDYVNVDAVPVPFYLRKFVRALGDSIVSRKLLAPVARGEEVVGFDARIDEDADRLYLLAPSKENVEARAKLLQELTDNYDQVTIPVYIGIGMRLSADLRALKGGISLTSLGAIATEAQANALSGTLTVQTLGVTGKSIAPILPLPSKLDQTTVENGILALGSSRSVLYSGSASEVTTTPRIVGLYSPVGSDPRLINVIYSVLSRVRPDWPWPCTKK